VRFPVNEKKKQIDKSKQISFLLDYFFIQILSEEERLILKEIIKKYDTILKVIK
jgi:hypothetical protein